ncbi:MAG: glycine zipper 2TM domain-containing protein [Phenylobacterium sp.]|uniref:glycine zipper 2TM domain-containing protein n=1 Tax=Phenylobacterium sp. TaxID=1871053 RepID=UPI00391C4E4C
MFNRSRLAKGALTAVAGVMALTGALSVPSFAAAQSAGYYGGYNYDPCRRDQTNRGTAGALIGGAIGAVIGSNAAARNARTEGALLGGALGAATGAAVGNRSAACAPSYASPPRTSYNYNRPYNDGRYYDNRYSANDRYYDSYDSYDSYAVTERPGADGCTLAESPIYLPDGRVQKRFVRVCQDGGGRYQVVD